MLRIVAPVCVFMLLYVHGANEKYSVSHYPRDSLETLMYVFCNRIADLYNHGVMSVNILIEALGSIRQQRPQTAAPFEVCLYKVSDKAVDCWPDLRVWQGTAIYQVQVAHTARPSMVFNLRKYFSEFLKDMSSKNHSYPGNLDVLRDEGHIKLVVSDKIDSENIGFVQCIS